MPPLDGYESFRELSEVLRKEGFVDAAGQLDEAMRTGSTGSEVLGELGLALRSIESVLGAPEIEPMARLVARCKSVIRIVWPDYQ